MRIVSIAGTMCLLPPTLIWQQKGGERMEILLSFIVSVAAGIATYYICKWLDRHARKEQ